MDGHTHGSIMEIGTGYDLGEIELESGVEDAYLASTVNVTDQPVTGFPPLFQPISENERNLLIELMKRCEDIHDSKRHYSELYVRFLRARQWKIDDAEKMFRNMVKWRKEFDLENKIAAFCGSASGAPHPHYAILSKYWPGRMMIGTRDGSLIWMERLGQIDPDDLFVHVSLSSVLLYHFMHLEEIEKYRRKQFIQRGYSPGFLLLQDATGMGMKHTNAAIIEYVKRFIATDSDNYPEQMRQTFFINCPALFSGVYALVKGFMDANTQSKIAMFSSGLNDKVVALVDPQILPGCIGGTSEMSFNTAGAIATPPDRTKVAIPAGDCHRHEVEIDVPNSKISFEFRTKGYNIEFSVRYTSKEDSEVVFGPARMDSHVAVVADDILCQKAGTYTLEFDNSFSKFRSKDLSYSVQIVAPVTPASPSSEKTKRRKKKSTTSPPNNPV